ncbi:TIGR01459 family HAD-type hydrolase [Candidatus Liberibacter americanus]|uniref:TIGR01459 family HAD-type hydrolase n=1 Tax=Candidatus Liberibacter americanus TaxID=309868 RepID=UPI0002C60EA3|nr:TIGR01459 family HAD-type hydrolase [Candidatus Liberibacter americanus]EMS36094.1 hypothetical protein G653_03241 [Candidatus Liberibacter americanus PW_SP]
MSIKIDSLYQISKNYDIIICDIWGVIHNGQKLFSESISALQKASKNGIKIVLLSNSPRPSSSVIEHMISLGLCKRFWDHIVTSGDLTHNLISQGNRNIFFIGEKKDLVLFEGIDIQIVDEKNAETIICTGLYSGSKIPEDYTDLLKKFAQRKIPFICVNPDISVNYGNKIIHCAGSLALIYKKLNGIVKIIGKPHLPIYNMAFKQISDSCCQLDKKRILAIGDGIETDIKGAIQSGLDSLYVGKGIHANEYLENKQINVKMMEKFFINKNIQPNWWIPKLI